MSEGERFVDKCLTNEVHLEPWPYQIINDTLSQPAFAKLQASCDTQLKYETSELHHIFPRNYQEYNLDFYDETVDICKKLLKNYKTLCGKYPKHRTYPNLGINAHISITPPLPYKFHIHQEYLQQKLLVKLN